MELLLQNFVVTATTFAINGTTVDISISGAAGTDNINTGTAATFSSSVSIANSIFHVGDDNTHFGFPAADTFALSTGGVQRLNISQTVNITPEDNQADAFSVKQGSNEYITVDTTNSSERVTIGNVTTNPEVVILSNTGIGTTNPEKPLHVFSATGDSMTRFESGDATIQLELKDSDGSAAIGAVGNAFRILTSGGGGDERVRVSAAGSFGIGLTDPKSFLHVTGAAAAQGGQDLIRCDQTSDSGVQQATTIGFGKNETDIHPMARLGSLELDTGDRRGGLIFETRENNSDSAPTERLRITDGGDIGIGTNDTPSDPSIC